MATAEQDVLEEAIVPETRCVYFLGCFEKRVTFYAQQVRALNLVHAILSENAVRPTGSVAVVGGGLAGLTVAAAFAKAAPLVNVVMYEASESLLDLQRGARDRFVHPHIFDWPAPVAATDQADLPFLSWQAGFAADVIEKIYAEFESIRRGSRIEVRTKHPVTGIDVVGGDAARVKTVFGASKELYDAVILSVGFGIERGVSPQKNPSYWSPSILPAPFVSEESVYTVFVSGNGDGGLADFALAAFGGKNHCEILTLVTNHVGLQRVCEELVNIDNEAWQDQDFDIYLAYHNRLGPLIPHHLLHDVFDLLRPNAQIVFHTRERHPFRRDTAILSRFLAFLIVAADTKFERGSIEIVTGVNFSITEDGTHTVILSGRPPIKPQIQLLRFGPDTEKNMQPFHVLAQRYLRARETGPTHRPMTPSLLPLAIERWAPPNVPVAKASDRTDDTDNPDESQAADLVSHVSTPNSNQINVVHGGIAQGATVIQSYHISGKKAGS